MSDKDKIIQLHQKWGLEAQPLNTEIVMDCANAIQGLEEASSNLAKIALMADPYEAKRALMKELKVILADTTAMLIRYAERW